MHKGPEQLPGFQPKDATYDHRSIHAQEAVATALVRIANDLGWIRMHLADAPTKLGGIERILGVIASKIK